MIPSINDYDNYGYPAHFNNGCVFLGCFDDEDVEIDIEKDSIEDVPDYWVDIFTVDLDIMDELCKNATGAGSVSVKGASLILDCDDDANAMLIPLTYDKGYKVVDDAANIYDYAALFTLLTEFGDEQVTIKYVPIGYMLGIIIGLLALVADIVVFGVKKLVIKANRLITVMYIGAMLSAVAVMYVIPVAVAIFKLYVFR